MRVIVSLCVLSYFFFNPSDVLPLLQKILINLNEAARLNTCSNNHYLVWLYIILKKYFDPKVF